MRILVIRYRYLGDTVLAIPFLRNLRAAFPQATIDVLVEPRAGAVLAACPYINELIPWHRRPAKNAPTPPCSGFIGAARFLRARRYDRVYVLRRATSTAILAALAGIPHRVGFRVQGSSLLLHRAVPYPESKHEVECFLDLLRADNVPVLDTHNENWTTPAAEAAIEQSFPRDIARHVFLAPISTNPAKDWPLDRMAELVRWLVNVRGCAVHFCGAPRDTDAHAEIVRLAGPLQRTPLDWSKQLDLPGALALLRRMDVAIGIDTGQLHLAASFQIPVVALYGFQSPARWHPWGTRYVALRAKPDARGGFPMSTIEVAEVCAAFDEVLAT